MTIFFSKLIGTLAVILVIAAFFGGSDLFYKATGSTHRWSAKLITGILGGVFGIYGNISGVGFNGAVVSVRDMGPMLAGFLGGPFSGLLAGIIAGVHRFTMGGITATACIVATCCIGLICGLLSRRYHERLVNPLIALGVGAAMEALHLGIVLMMVRPFETALGIVQAIAIPFIAVNSIGFTLMIAFMSYTERQRTLNIEQGRLKSDLETASVIQHSLLPAITDTYPGREEVNVRGFMKAAKNVGGDFYDLFFLNSDKDKLVVLVADVSGKGVPAALFMATAKLTLQNCIRDFDSLSEAVQAANDGLCARNEAEMFVTAWIGVLDLKTGGMDCVCAGHNPPVIVTGEGPEYLRLRSGFVLGGMEGIFYREQHVDLNPGDVLFLYTDGVTEAENTLHELYGEERLLQCLSGLGNQDPPVLLEGVQADVAGFVKEADQFDDITMLCLKYSGASGS